MAEAILDCVTVHRHASQSAERAAFEQLVRANQAMIVRLALGILRDRDAAHDVAQETFFRAFQHYRTFRSDAAFSTWAYRIAVNLCLDAMRRTGGRIVEPLDEIEMESSSALKDPEPGPEGHATVHELLQKADAALEQLTVNHRTVLLLREVEGLSYAEIARVLRIPRGTVMSRLHHARLNLQKAFRRLTRASRSGRGASVVPAAARRERAAASIR